MGLKARRNTLEGDLRKTHAVSGALALYRRPSLGPGTPTEAVWRLEQFRDPVSEKADPGHRYDQGNGQASQRQDAIEHCLHDTCSLSADERPCGAPGACVIVAWHLG